MEVRRNGARGQFLESGSRGREPREQELQDKTPYKACFGRIVAEHHTNAYGSISGVHITTNTQEFPVKMMALDYH